MIGRQYIVSNLAWTPSPDKLELRTNHLIIIDEHGYIELVEPVESSQSKHALERDNVEEKDLTRLSPHGFLFPAFVVGATPFRLTFKGD